MTNKMKDALTISCGLIIPIILFLGISIRQVRDERGDLYTPGESIKKNERVAVESLNDSTLNARVATYNELLQGYKKAQECAVAPNGHTPYMQRPVHRYYQEKLKATNIKCVLPRTLRDYKDILDSYTRDSIETRYQYLRDSIKAQKVPQKQK